MWKYLHGLKKFYDVSGNAISLYFIPFFISLYHIYSIATSFSLFLEEGKVERPQSWNEYFIWKSANMNIGHFSSNLHTKARKVNEFPFFWVIRASELFLSHTAYFKRKTTKRDFEHDIDFFSSLTKKYFYCTIFTGNVLSRSKFWTFQYYVWHLTLKILQPKNIKQKENIKKIIKIFCFVNKKSLGAAE